MRLQRAGERGIIRRFAKVAELVDAPDLGSGAERCGGSSPPFRTIERDLKDMLHGINITVMHFSNCNN